MKIKTIIITVIILTVSRSWAQPMLKGYKWEEIPKIEHHDLNKNEYDLIVKDFRSLQFGYDNDNFIQYFLKHQIIYVGTEKGIERNNRIYIVSDNFLETYFHKVRVVSSQGKITELDQSDIKEATDESTGNSYKYYALEGLEVGSYVENMYLVKMYASYQGNKEVFQSDVRTKNVDFEIISPNHLLFKAKSYNGLPELEKDTTIEDNNRLFFNIKEIEGQEYETNAANVANRKYLIYKLDRNTGNNSKDISSYGGASKLIYSSMYPIIDKATSKGLSRIIEESGAGKENDKVQQIRLIENFIKTHYAYIDKYSPQLYELQNIITNKGANKKGMVRLYAALFNKLEIENQIVLTSDRMNLKFDPDFEAYNFLTHYLIYFPELGDFIAPNDVSLRYGFIPYEVTNNHGLFVKPLEIGELKTGIGKVNYIDALGYDKNFNNINIDLNFSEDLSESICTLETKMGGYYAQGIQPYYNLLTVDQKRESAETYIRYVCGDVDIENMIVENENENDFGIRPFIVKASFVTEDYTEKAGSKVLFKIGKLIGEQMEMYKESERKQDVESSFNRIYDRKIIFKIPNGYNPTNLAELNMNVVYDNEKEEVMAFKSSYTQKDNEISVTIQEYYKEIIVPVAHFESYQKVINAAADFNKKMLIFEKK